MFEDELEHVGRVLGLEPATTTEFRVLIDEANYLQLDDLVVVRTMVPKAGEVRIYGVVTEVAARYEGSRFESDTLRIDEEFTMDADKSRSATVQTMRVVPEIWVAPDPGVLVVTTDIWSAIVRPVTVPPLTELPPPEQP